MVVATAVSSSASNSPPILFMCEGTSTGLTSPEPSISSNTRGKQADMTALVVSSIPAPQQGEEPCRNTLRTAHCGCCCDVQPYMATFTDSLQVLDLLLAGPQVASELCSVVKHGRIARVSGGLEVRIQGQVPVLLRLP